MMKNQLPKGFCSNCVKSQKNQSVTHEKTDYSTPFRFSEKVMKGKKKIIATLLDKSK